MGYMQGSLGLGMLLGPVISSLVYPLFKYSYTFVFYGVSILIFGVGASCLLPSRLNKDKKAEPAATSEEEPLHDTMVDDEKPVAPKVEATSYRTMSVKQQLV